MKGWTAPGVAAALVAAFRLLPNAAIRGTAAIGAPHARTSKEVELLALTGKYLGETSLERVMLLSWGRARASGHSIAALCAARGWTRRRLYRRRDAAAAAVARGLNQDGVPP
jgi:hypothetical protein